VETFERGDTGVDFDNNLVSHLDQFRGGTNGSTRNDPAILSDSGRFNNHNVELVVVRLILGIIA
jgi:hypothetical protein